MPVEKFAAVFDFDGKQVLLYREPSDKSDSVIAAKELDSDMIVMCATIGGIFARIKMDGITTKRRDGDDPLWKSVEELFSLPENAKFLEDMARAALEDFEQMLAPKSGDDEEES
jgi:hypothetical protein